MIEILHRLLGLYMSLKTSHWNAEGDDFYQAHKLFEALYSDLDEQMDDLVELLKALEEQELSAKEILKQAIEFAYDGEGFEDDVKEAIRLIEELRKILQEIDSTQIDLGLYNFASTLSEKHLKKLYLLKANVSGNN